MSKVMITGITGMIGSFLSKKLLSSGYEVSGISRSTSDSRQKDYKHYLGDIQDAEFVRKAFSDYNPDVVFHLAAQAFNGQSWVNTNTTYLTNVFGSKNVFDAWRDVCPYARMIPACSSAEYGDRPFSVSENDELRPISPYGVSKACMEMMAWQYAQNYKLNVVFPRLFIHIGPGHPPYTAVQNFAKQAAMCSLGQTNTIEHGKLDYYRDFVDVRDGVDALILLMKEGINGQAYNVCSGVMVQVSYVLDVLFGFLSQKPVIKEVSSQHRPGDEEFLVGDPSKINALGWYPKIHIEQTLQEIFENWIERLKWSQ